ncbi:Hypothetical protein PMN2A_2179 [Prochlorococcus marinus str. NATL2A]|uniref:Uncharacterized protein n=1 Tax=Prochlorococcus marinus (strain NATL2A) TaxID=59920 RepID=A7ME10_PROMT|nr:hypothetical protein [Prochlorococcus marinus]ABU24098.1 Hypothetical protein PMN2A_2179 [Prochlorococcus marinus str. NATL2A]
MSKQAIINTNTDTRLNKALVQINKNASSSINSEPMKKNALIDSLLNAAMDKMVRDKKIKL